MRAILERFGPSRPSPLAVGLGLLQQQCETDTEFVLGGTKRVEGVAKRGTLEIAQREHDRLFRRGVLEKAGNSLGGWIRLSLAKCVDELRDLARGQDDLVDVP